jgi:hypothetical protein
MNKSAKRLALRITALAAATMGLSGCYYDMGLSAYDSGYSSYDCDPYSPFDTYYDCDYGYGFYNIGYGGGWHQNYWYPGYGMYMFDNYGRRFSLGNDYRRYWAERRHRWYRDNRGHGGGHHRNGYGQSSGSGYDPVAWPERNGGRIRDRDGRRRGDGHNGNGGYSNGGQGDPGHGRGRGRGRGRNGWNPNGQPQPAAAPVPQQPVADPTAPPPPGRWRGGEGRRGEGRGQGRGRFGVMPNNDGRPDAGNAGAPAPAPRFRPQNSGQNSAPSAPSYTPPAPQPRAPRNDPPPSRPSRGGENVRPD